MVNGLRSLPWLFLVAALLSTIALLARCTHRGNICGSLRSCAWAIGVVTASAAASACLAVFAGYRLFPGLNPFVASVALPLTLSAGKMLGRQREAGTPPHPALSWATAGIALLLDRLDQRMSLDKDEWVTDLPYQNWTNAELERRAVDLHDRLIRLTQENPDRKPDLTMCLRTVKQKLAKCNKTQDEDIHRRNRNEAEQAFLRLRTKQYEWGYHGASPISRRRIRAHD